MALAPHASLQDRIGHYAVRSACGLVLAFLIAPILVIVPLSFNAEPYFTFTDGMLHLQADAFSTRWYADILRNGMADPDQPFGWAFLSDAWSNAQWVHSAKNSFVIAIAATLLSTILGTLAALGLSQKKMPARGLITSLLISPMIVPMIISAAGMYFLFSRLGLTNTYAGIVIAHTVFGTPFVVMTVTATLTGFDHSLTRAAFSLGASPTTTFFRVILPLILPGVVSGSLFAFVTSFDEVIAVIFLTDYDQRTIPRQMWSGIREQISPTILAVATILVLLSIALLATVELLRRRSARLRGIAG